MSILVTSVLMIGRGLLVQGPRALLTGCMTAVPGESSQNLTSEQFRVALLGDSVFLSRYYEVSTATPWATDTLPSTPRESILSTWYELRVCQYSEVWFGVPLGQVADSETRRYSLWGFRVCAGSRLALG